MKLFTKLALVSAVAVSSNAMAMQAMDDAALSATTGQDGISIGIGISKVDIAKVHVFDGDGLAAAGTAGVDAGSGGTGKTGAITLNNVVLNNVNLTKSIFLGCNLKDVDFSTSIINGISFDIKSLNGIIINRMDAGNIVSMFNVRVRD